jgi:DNA-binding transcriptional ArsR family regulator
MKGLAHPTRLRIVSRLCRADATVTELCNELGVGQSLVSQHLSPLRMLGLVRVDRAGGKASYSLAEPRLRSLVDCLASCGSRLETKTTDAGPRGRAGK